LVNHPWVKGIPVCSNKAPSPLQRGDTNHPLVKGFQVCSNKGPDSLQTGDNNKNVKMGWGHLKILFSRTT
jgi:hypothetical protein